MHTCGRMCKDIGVKTTFLRTMGISFRLHPERSRGVAPRAEPRVAPRAKPRVAPRAKPRGWCIYIGFLVSASLDEQFERSRVLHPERSRVLHHERSRVHPERSRGLHPERSRGLYPERSRGLYPERSRGVHIHISFSSRLRSTSSL